MDPTRGVRDQHDSVGEISVDCARASVCNPQSHASYREGGWIGPLSVAVDVVLVFVRVSHRNFLRLCVHARLWPVGVELASG